MKIKDIVYRSWIISIRHTIVTFGSYFSSTSSLKKK